MYEWTKKIHMYSGLLSFTAFVVWGIAGLWVTLLPAPPREPPPEEISHVDFQAGGDLSDAQIAERIAGAVDLPFAAGVPRPQRNSDNQLTLTFYTPNGRRRLVLLEDENRVRIEARRNNIWQYLDSLHAATNRHYSPVWPLRMWGYYNEFSIWALLFMCGSGVYLWLASRPGLAWARYTVAGGSGAAALLYVLMR